MSKKITPATFIETELRRSAYANAFSKAFVLKLDEIHFTCSPEITFEEIKPKLLKMAKEYLDNAQYMTSEEYDNAYMERLKELSFEDEK